MSRWRRGFAKRNRSGADTEQQWPELVMQLAGEIAPLVVLQ